MKKLDIGIDLDGIGYDFVAALRSWITYKTGRHLQTMPDAQVWDFFTHQWGMTTAEFLQSFADGVNAGFIFRDGIPMHGFTEMMKYLTEKGHRVHIVTSRHVAGAEVMAEINTHHWLTQWNIPYDSLTFSDAKDCIKTDAFLDDAPHNYDALEKAGYHPWFLTRPWNAEHPGRRVDYHMEFCAVADGLSDT